MATGTPFQAQQPLFLPPPAPSPTPGKGGAPGLQPPNFDFTPTFQPGLGAGPETPFLPLPQGPPVTIAPLPGEPFMPLPLPVRPVFDDDDGGESEE